MKDGAAKVLSEKQLEWLRSAIQAGIDSGIDETFDPIKHLAFLKQQASKKKKQR